ncbi:tetratricopeptide repeat protein [Crocinitomix sp.]|nr:tetratricopeptide repeat protein [Crocinitomix sp.]
MTKEEYFALGMVKVKENDHHAAIEMFSIVLKEDPTNADALSQRGVAYLNIEEYVLSLDDMNLAIKHDPEYSFRYQSRGYLKARLRDHEGAIKDYEKAVELDPSDGIAYNNLALAQEQMGWAGKAKENFDKSDQKMGVKTAEDRAKERMEQNANAKAVESAETNLGKGDIAKSVFTQKSSFKEFIQFIKNGFKLKQ